MDRRFVSDDAQVESSMAFNEFCLSSSFLVFVVFVIVVVIIECGFTVEMTPIVVSNSTGRGSGSGSEDDKGSSSLLLCLVTEPATAATTDCSSVGDFLIILTK